MVTIILAIIAMVGVVYMVADLIGTVILIRSCRKSPAKAHMVAKAFCSLIGCPAQQVDDNAVVMSRQEYNVLRGKADRLDTHVSEQFDAGLASEYSEFVEELRNID